MKNPANNTKLVFPEFLILLCAIVVFSQGEQNIHIKLNQMLLAMFKSFSLDSQEQTNESAVWMI